MLKHIRFSITFLRLNISKRKKSSFSQLQKMLIFIKSGYSDKTAIFFIAFKGKNSATLPANKVNFNKKTNSLLYTTKRYYLFVVFCSIFYLFVV